ncbi:YlcI/YnfO family protein [Obesumbacterium proteus]|uniref:YlcI/YnfO family protein n=1 Tax=Obesumbacterium proteus TaxID=82983 RepID=UPI001F3563C9|nr:YlcI/YnfO family protein [Obesumbacterium proteus]MCE9886534.1 hypothetical protein [Obesumbacterium proteus]MCE9918094.1 hypothetical protein [Obesumbacterium proteus]MCE9931203.1 hypothetical protein [Obesumbacterium proteus]MCG2879154.1 hypothetical protein [Obesumbacterium proteus]
MATGRKNNRSLQVSVRLPLDDLELIEQVKEDGESTAGFLVTAARGEIKRRQRKIAKQDND